MRYNYLSQLPAWRFRNPFAQLSLHCTFQPFLIRMEVQRHKYKGNHSKDELPSGAARHLLHYKITCKYTEF